MQTDFGSDNRFLGPLRLFFLAAGWFSLALLLVHALSTVYIHFYPLQYPGSVTFTSPPEAPLAGRLVALMSGVGNAYFAFFMAGVLQMLRIRGPLNVQRAESFLLLSCTAWMLQAVLILVQWAMGISFRSYPFAFDLPLLLYFLTTLLEIIPPCLYAATTYIVFKHFKRMITFESEVA